MAERHEVEKLAVILQTMKERRANDPIFTYHLHAKQQAFVDSVLQMKKKENWFIAANRSGKSDAGAYVGAHLARFGSPGEVRPAIGKPAAGGSTIEVRDRATSGWVSALDFPTSRDVIQPKYFNNGFAPPGQAHSPFIPDHEIQEWRVADQVLKLKNGSIIGFKSAETGRKKYQGAEKDWFHMDEEHPYDIYEEAVIRVGTRPLLFYCTATILPPEGTVGGASWVFPQIIQPFLDGRTKHIGVFGASIYDNPGIPRDEIARLESLYPEGSLSRRIRLEGEWLPGIGGARAYHAFNRQIHVVKQPELNLRRPLCWTWDFNVEPMCSVIGQTDGLVYRVFREFYLQEGNIPEMCQMFYDNFPNHQAEIWLYGDATSNRRTGQTGQTDYWTILNEMKGYGVPIRMKVPQENPKVPDRVNAVNRILLDEDGQVRLTIDQSCQELASDLDNVLRDNRGGIMKTNNKKDPYFWRTHISDALGYWINYEEPVRPPSVTRDRNVTIPQPSYGRR